MRGGVAAVITRRSVRLPSLLGLFAVGACTSIVGIEDLHEGPRPGGATEGGDGSGGSQNNGGKAGGEALPQAGAAEGGTGVAGNVALGGSPEAGGPAASAGAGGDADVPVTSPVHGTIVDFWGHKLPNIPVQIGGTLTSTDARGEFAIDDVPTSYDVSFVTSFEFNTVKRTFAWVYQGLTRRDPTLSAITALTHRFGNVQIAAQASAVADNQTISVAFGGVDGTSELTGLDGTLKNGSVSWEGAASTQLTAHGLFWQYDTTTSLPTSYLAYDSTLLAASESQAAKITLDLTKKTQDYAPLQGKVTPSSGEARTNEVFVQFTTGATMTLVSDTTGPDTFSYQVPNLANASISAQASEGNADYAYGVARAAGLSYSSKPSLVIPTPVTLTSPSEGITSGPATTFAFQTVPSNPGPFVVQFENVDGPFQTLYVVTAAKQLTLPEVIGGGFSLHAGNEIAWRVATHGTFASVDAMAGPDGFLQPYDNGNTVPCGPRTGSGEYTISDSRSFTTPK